MNYLLLFLTLIPTFTFASGAGFLEPMVYDLMRGLDVKKGEVEFNFLNSSNLSSDDQHILINPEIEYAILDGLAFELEIPIDRKVLSSKWGLQYRLSPESKRFMAGIQVIYERFVEDKREDFYLTGIFNYRLSREISLVTVLGGREATMKGLHHHYVLIVNLTLFYQLNDRFSLGLENDRNIYYGEKKVNALTIPQISWQVNHHFKVQTGVGFNWHNNKDIEGYSRFIFEF